MLHGAGPQWIETGVDAEVLLAEAGEVTNHLGLRKTGKPDFCLSLETAQTVFLRIRRGQVDPRSALGALLEEERFFEIEPMMAGRRPFPSHGVSPFRPARRASMSPSFVNSVTATSRWFAISFSPG